MNESLYLKIIDYIIQREGGLLIILVGIVVFGIFKFLSSGSLISNNTTINNITVNNISLENSNNNIDSSYLK